jgi:4-alpha-glucanotransferase
MRRASGILLHITSLPSPFGIGDLGPGAYRFADFLHETGQSYWQVLPLNPLNPRMGNSPYSGTSAFASNPYLISPEKLVEEGLLSRADIVGPPLVPGGRADYRRAAAFKKRIFERAFLRFKKHPKHRREFERFCVSNAFWLDDYALFITLEKRLKTRAWNTWPKDLKTRKPEALEDVRRHASAGLEKIKFLQFLFFNQWAALKDYCAGENIRIIGDLPIYAGTDSADAWSRPDLFKLTRNLTPIAVAGVPPDYFSKTGQRWGNPVYDWAAMKRSGFDWWLQRMRHNLQVFDYVRVDHFRGLVSFWQIPARRKTALAGRWVKAPVYAFLDTLLEAFPGMPIIAEDLGTITKNVKEVLREYGFPGMKVLLFAFRKRNPDHPYLPHTYEKNCVVYTGTHDNNTVRGWFEAEASKREKGRLRKYLGKKVEAETVHRDFIEMAMTSAADLAIIPLQDVLGLGAEARMNTPATAYGNWRWRFEEGQIDEEARRFLRAVTRAGRRTP